MKKLLAYSIILAVTLITLYSLLDDGIIWFVYPDRDTYPVRGVDVSYHKGDIDWQAVAHDDVQFAYLKATEGDDFKDSKFQENWKAANAAGLWVGAYHFYSLRFSGEVQAKNFIDSVPVQKESLPPVVDLEYGGNSKERPSKEDFQKELSIYLDIVRMHYQQEPILYVTKDFYRDYLYPEFKGSPLWVRDLFGEPDDELASWKIWQYKNRGHVDGIGGYVDLNVMRANNLPGIAKRLSKSFESPLPGNELSEEDQIIKNAFCADIDDGTTEGISFTDRQQAQGIDWDDQDWCFRKNRTELMTLSMHNGILGNLNISSTPKSFLSDIYSIQKKTPVTETKIHFAKGYDQSDIGTCFGRNTLTIFSPTERIDGFYNEACQGRATDKPHEIYMTNLDGSYVSLFSYLEKIIPWSPTHLPKFSDFQIPSGHFEIKTRSCGSDCNVATITNTQTGKVLPEIGSDGAGNFDYKSNSRLLIATNFSKFWGTFSDKTYYLLQEDTIEHLYNLPIYHNYRYNFSFSPPGDWEISEEPGIHDGRSFNAPYDVCQLTAYGVMVNVDREKFPKFLLSLTDSYDAQKNITFAGTKGVLRESEKSLWAYTQHGDAYYSIGLTCDNKEFLAANKKYFDDAVATFTIE